MAEGVERRVCTRDETVLDGEEELLQTKNVDVPPLPLVWLAAVQAGFA